ncbi:MAG: phosphate butyryltransferase [Muribaculaceae bacterium]|nr:phosphate butyryltransferase [Muribaculaceae bacterium]
MQFIRNFTSLFSHLAAPGRHRARVAVACPHDESTLEAVDRALALGIADFVLVGNPEVIAARPFMTAYRDRVELVPELDTDTAAARAVALVREGRADVLMKGLLNTDNLLRAILNKEHGILSPGSVLTHVTATQIPGVDRLIMFSDAAVIPFPTAEQRVAMVAAVAKVCRGLGISSPRIALIHCSEKTSPKFPVTADYAMLREMCAAGAFGSAVVDGPMDVKTACDPHSGAVKGIDSPIAGMADGLIFPDIEAGNVFYKTVTCFSHALNAGMLVGASSPVVLPSRSDDTESKLTSLALACACA